MQTKKLINSKPAKRKSECLSNLSIVETQKHFSVFAVTNKGGFVPLRMGDLAQVIDEAEHCAAYFDLPIQHELNQPVRLIVQVYKQVGALWPWAGQEVRVYGDADEAYLNLRKLGGTVEHSHLTVQTSEKVKHVFTCSQDCTRQWNTLLHRLRFNGGLPDGRHPGECPRCFSRFVKSLEGGELCLNCGYE